MKRLFITVTLFLILATSAFAGEMPFSPPPPPSGGLVDTTESPLVLAANEENQQGSLLSEVRVALDAIFDFVIY